VLTSYSQYHNRKYKKIGHVFQGRYKSILCQTDRYLGELVRYIHLNPVRAKIVKRPESYEYSGHRAYIGQDTSGLVDTDPVLRHFGGTKKRAVEAYRRFVEAGLGEPSQDNYYRASEGRLLGSDEFLEEIRHRVGDHLAARTGFERTSVADLLTAAERSSGLSRQELCSKNKNRKTVEVRDAVIVVGRERGISNRELAEALGIDGSSVTKRVEVARVRGAESVEMKRLRKGLRKKAP
jgi:putative transposase